jgi:uncharacterized membrane protein YfcA
VAGAVGSAGGVTSLISFPALLAVGINPLPANVTQVVAFVASWPGSALGSRAEPRGQAPLLRHWAPLIAAASCAGVALLLCVLATVFARLVPLLLVSALPPFSSNSALAGGTSGISGATAGYCSRAGWSPYRFTTATSGLARA